MKSRHSLRPDVLALAFDVVDAPVCVMDEQRRFVFVNQAFYELMSLSPSGALGMRLDEILPRKRTKRLIDLLAEAFKTDEGRLEGVELDLSGEKRIAVSGRVCADPATGTRYFAASFQDVSDRWRVGEELLRVKEEAENARRTKSEFIATMTHELRTPLNGSIGMLHLLNSTQLTAEQREYANLSMTANKNLLEIINDILDYSRIIGGDFKLDARNFSVRGAIESVTGTLKPQADGKGLGFYLDIADDVPERMRGDGARLRQILFNLVGNAVKFTRSGEVRVKTRYEPDGEDPSAFKLHFSISDTGIGIPQDKLASIFDPFTQVDASYTRRFQGTGLGLGIVKRLVELMRGEISVKSQPGQGATVSFYIRGTLSEISRSKPIPQFCALPPRLKVLLAEDDGTNQIMISRMLEKMGHRSYCVENGAEALKALKNEHFDCILMDVQMPLISGLDAAKAIRMAPGFGERSKIPIIAVTAHNLKGDRERCLKAGMDECLHKPFSMEELSQKLSKVLGEAALKGPSDAGAGGTGRA